MEIKKASIKQRQGTKVGSFASAVASKQREVSELNKQSNIMQSISSTFTKASVNQLQKNAEQKAMEDAGRGELDMNSTQYTVYGQAYARKANVIAQTNFNIRLEEAQSQAKVNNETDIEGYNADMEEFYGTQTQGVSDDQLIERQQAYELTRQRGQRTVVKNKTDKINGEYTASIQAWAEESRKSILEHADAGDKDAYAVAQDQYVGAVSELLENRLVTPEKARLMIKNQYDEGTEEFIMSDFDTVLGKDVNSAINYAEKFSSAKDTAMYEDGTLLYDVPQRDAMYAKMIARIKAQNTTDKSGRARALKLNNGIVRNAIEVLKDGGDPSELSVALSFTEEEIDPLLYMELRAEQAQLPERVAFAQMTSQLQFTEIHKIENDRRAGKKLSVYENRLLNGYKEQASKKASLIQTDPSLVREQSLSSTRVQYTGDNLTEYLQLNQDSVASFAQENGGKQWYFNDADAKVVTGQYNAMDSNGKLDFIAEVKGALGDDSRYVFEQLGHNNAQVVVLNQTLDLDPSRETSKLIMDGTEMLSADKTLLPKKVSELYNTIDKSSMSEYSTKMKTQIKNDVLALAVAINGGGDADDIGSFELETAYDMIVGQTVTSGWFGRGTSVTAPWKGASYEDFDIAIQNKDIGDMPEFINQDSEAILDLIQSGDSGITYKNAGVGDYNVFYNGVRLIEKHGEPIEYTDEKGKAKTRRRTQPYVLEIRMP